MRPIILTDSARLLWLAAASLGIGAALNGARQHPLPWTYRPPPQRLQEAVAVLKPSSPNSVVAATSPVGPFAVIDLEAFQAFAAGGKGTVIDARAAAFYRQGHVPGALSLPRETFADDYGGVKGRLESRRSENIVVYCSEVDCPDADMVAGALARLGYEHLRIYKEGWEEWGRAGLPQEVTTAR